MRCTTTELFDLVHTLAAPLLQRMEYPWEALPKLHDFILQLGAILPTSEYEEISEHVWVARNADVALSASLEGPCIIGHHTQVRHCAYIRGDALVGDHCVVGNSTELKNVILFDSVQVPHFNYVGDSILGYMSHMGAGAITSNVKSDKTKVTVKDDASGKAIATKLEKLGAMLGDRVEIGCNSVLNPGTVIGRDTSVYPLTNVRGVVPENSILKQNGVLAIKL